MLVHGWGGSFATTWERSGFTALLADAGRPVVGVDLLGHGAAPKPHDPAAYDDETDPEALPQPLTDAELRRLLERSGIAHGPRAALTPDGLAVAPIDAPQVVQTVIQAANQIARLPYRYGGGHRTWIDTAYDCSASISYAFAAAGLLDRPLVSGQLAQWGEPGPGRWITIYANAEHAYMEVAGLRFDTSGLRQTGSRWQATPRAGDGFVVRHPPGL